MRGERSGWTLVHCDPCEPTYFSRWLFSEDIPRLVKLIDQLIDDLYQLLMLLVDIGMAEIILMACPINFLHRIALYCTSLSLFRQTTR